MIAVGKAAMQMHDNIKTSIQILSWLTFLSTKSSTNDKLNHFKGQTIAAD